MVRKRSKLESPLVPHNDARQRTAVVKPQDVDKRYDTLFTAQIVYDLDGIVLEAIL